MNLDYLFSPKSIAIIGVSDKTVFGRGTATGSLDSANSDHIYFIHPKRDELFGKKCYRSLQELPEVVECISLCVNSKLVNGYVEEAGKMGTKAAIVYASGYSEEGEEGRELEEELKAICQKYDMALCGPNCVGVYNKIEHLTGYSSPVIDLNMKMERGLGVVAQSGYINSNLMRTLPQYTAYGASCGNGTILSLEHYLYYYANNDHVNCIAAYVEGVKDAVVFEKALKIAAQKRKPVVMLKSGKSKKGSAAAASHTGNLAGDYKVFEAIMKKYGVIITNTLEEFISTAKMFAILDGNHPKTTLVGAVNFSGGENTLCADYCEEVGLEFGKLQEKTLQEIKKVIPAYSTAANPLDPTTELFNELDKVVHLFESISADPSVGLLLLGDDLGEKPEFKDETITKAIEVMKSRGTLIPTFLVPSFEKPRNKEFRARLESCGVPVLSTGMLSYLAIRNLCRFVEYQPMDGDLQMAIPSTQHTNHIAALSEFNSKQRIAELGIRIPQQVTVATEEALFKALDEIPMPVAMKVDSPDILHKTEAGGVFLNITDRNEAKNVFYKILENCKAYKADAKINGVQVQEMLRAGTELIVGIKNDKQYGPMLLVGLGGVFVEIFKDTALMPCPVTKQQARDMLESLKSFKMLNGYRGKDPCDLDALTDLMTKVSEFAAANRDRIAEIDLNPVMVYESGAGIAVADALIAEYLD